MVQADFSKISTSIDEQNRFLSIYSIKRNITKDEIAELINKAIFSIASDEPFEESNFLIP
jgi:hypothetical protein